MAWRRSIGLVAVALAAACGDDTGGGGGAGGGAGATGAGGSTTTAGNGGAATTSSASSGEGGGGEGGGGGGPDLDKDPAEVTSADECFFEGDGGANGWQCNAVTVVLEESVDVADLTFVVETSEGDTFEPASLGGGGDSLPYLVVDTEEASNEGGGLPTEGNATALVIRVDTPPPHYAPTWVDVEVRSGGSIVGAARFEDLTYQCVALSQDDWCWEAAPVTLPIEDAEAP